MNLPINWQAVAEDLGQTKNKAIERLLDAEERLIEANQRIAELEATIAAMDDEANKDGYCRSLSEFILRRGPEYDHSPEYD